MKRKEFLRNLALSVPVIGGAVSATAKPVSESQTRSVLQVTGSGNTEVAPGLTIRRSIPYGRLKMLDPFLLLDHMGPRFFKAGDEPAVPPHPHRGFEPITFLFDGKLSHKDSLGNLGRLKSGDVQWMTAGRGIVHAEYVESRKEETGDHYHGVQLWVNLPKKYKMTDPGYQNIKAETIPEINLDDNRALVRLVAGQAFGANGPARTFSNIQAMHVILKPGARAALPMPSTYNALAYVLEGDAADEGGQQAQQGEQFIYRQDGGQLLVSSKQGGSLLVLGGEPIREPVASYGPFVMNSMAEIRQAYSDYQAGKMGAINF